VLRPAAWFCAGAAAALVVLELALRLLPVTFGLYQTRGDLWPLHNFQPHAPFTYSMNWDMRNVRHGRTNNYGQIAPFDYVPASHPVIVVGDSYIEAQMDDYGDTLQGQLGAALKAAAPVYGFGASGMSLSDYLAVAGQSAAEFTPRAAVFLLINGDISESLLDRPGQHYFRETADGLRLAFQPMDGNSLARRIRQSVGEIHLYRYLRNNLRFTVPELPAVFREAKSRPAAAPAQAASAQRAVVDRFLAELPRRSGIKAHCTAFLLDADRYAIYDPRLAYAPEDLPEVRAYFIRKATELGYRVADLEPVFREHYEHNRRHFDFYPDDRHWNALGHRLAAERAYDLLFRKNGGGC
jgi:hypothetical protein